MEPLPQKVLNWLHRILQAQYQDVNRTYADSAQTLTQFKSLRPSTDVYTYEDGRSALLLRLAGTLPVNFRGAVYAFPVSIWVPYEYPRMAPIVLITPSKGMRIRPGQHVSGDGRVYHPFLAGWRPERSNILSFTRVLQDVFAHEPPVVATQEPPDNQNGMPPPRPPLPPELDRSGSAQEQRQPTSPSQPPQLPPKPFQEQQQDIPQSSNGPPVPARLSSYYGPSGPRDGPQNGSLGRSSPTNHNQRYSQAPPLPPQQHPQPPAFTHQAVPRPSSQGPPPPQQPPQAYQQQPPYQTQFYAPQQPYSQNQPQPYQNQPYQQQPYQPNSPAPQRYPQSHPSQPQPQAHKLPPQDLLSDPFDQPLPTHSESLPAPPIPPNPEKDALLRTLSHTLTSRLQSAVHTHTSAIQPLTAQHQAMQAALYNLQGEKAALSALSGQLAANSELMGQAMRDADACIARARTASVPGLDEVLVAPTVVGQQMYELVAEVQACQGAREVLGRALDRGRIGAEGWVKAVRGIAREEFLKKVLVEKAAKGMGLRMNEQAVGHEGGWI